MIGPVLAIVGIGYLLTRKGKKPGGQRDFGGNPPAGASIDLSNIPTPGPAIYVQQFSRVLARFNEAEGVPYVYAGGHPPTASAWPDGTATASSGDVEGFDCSGFVNTALVVEGIGLPDLSASGLAAYVSKRGQLRTPETAIPGDVVWFANAAGKIQHVGFLLIPGGGFPSLSVLLPAAMQARAMDGIVVSAFRGGSATHGRDPKAKVQWHTIRGTGLTPCAVWSWMDNR